MSILNKILGRIYYILYNSYTKNVYDTYRKTYDLHTSFHFNGEGIKMYGDGKIIIDENSYIGRFSILQSSKNYEINIGKNCSIGPFFNIWTHSSEIDYDFNFKELIKPKIGSIIVKDGVWIGVNVFISPGVTIGNNAVIGANSVVTVDVPDFGIVGGVPAKIIRYKKIKP